MKMNFHLSLHHLIPSSPFLIPYATHAKAVLHRVVVAVYIGNAVVQNAEPSVARIVLCTTPPETEVANGVVRPIAAADTAREACESAFIGSACVG